MTKNGCGIEFAIMHCGIAVGKYVEDVRSITRNMHMQHSRCRHPQGGRHGDGQRDTILTQKYYHKHRDRHRDIHGHTKTHIHTITRPASKI